MSIKFQLATNALALFMVSSVAEAQSFRLIEATIDDVHSALSSQQITCRELVKGYLNRIEAYDKEGPGLNSIQHINSNAMEIADSLDAAFSESGLVGPLHCIPVLLKDQVETLDMPTTYGSALFEGFMSGRDATIVIRMREAGAIVPRENKYGRVCEPLRWVCIRSY